MNELHLLVAEGNVADVRDRMKASAGTTPGESYAQVLRELAPGTRVDVCRPTDAGEALPAALDSYDGLVITGSALNIYKREAPALRQVEFVRAAYAAGVPMFGSCWGLQLGTVAAGGSVALNPRGRESGFARRISLTESGRAHSMHVGRPGSFDAPAMHSDEVVQLPPDAIVTATNAMTAVQAAEIRQGKSVFWGVQYHPEFSLSDIALVIRHLIPKLVEEGLFADAEVARAYVDDLLGLHREPLPGELARRLELNEQILDPILRTREIGNWVERVRRANP